MAKAKQKTKVAAKRGAKKVIKRTYKKSLKTVAPTAIEQLVEQMEKLKPAGLALLEEVVAENGIADKEVVKFFFHKTLSAMFDRRNMITQAEKEIYLIEGIQNSAVALYNIGKLTKDNLLSLDQKFENVSK